MKRTRKYKIKNFAKLMLEVLKQNDYKNGWEKCEIGWLIKKLKEETLELELAYENSSSQAIAKEAVDIANFALMIVDVSGELQEKK